ncbi:la-related protein 7 [Contarinia nasturtii]|uniref:la-related protein 7 n=1 Tax=Contarinia nasturtii TaxID=265458 RepID=UPI0012D3867E|nr:la-related protein 7 [Contarinia nasturtii]
MEQPQCDIDATKQAGKIQNSRKRKKQYFNRIRQQMEFYFGDSNLSKDRFLSKLMAENPYVPLDVFLTFNKIKAMANSIEELQKAIDGSEMLELSDDRQSVRRTTEIQKKDQLDEYMIYVEALPPNATHDSVRHQFSQFGNVAYVSLPKYKKSGRIKEFAFVEFEEKSSVEKCIQAFQQFDGVIGGVEDAKNLASVSSYIKEQEELEKTEQPEKLIEDEDKENKTEDEKPCESEPNSDDESVAPKQSLDAPSTSNDEDVPSERAKIDESAGSQEKDNEVKEEEDFVPATKRMKIIEPESDRDEAEDKEGDGDGDEDREGEHDAEKEGDGQTEPKKKRRRRRNRNPSCSAVKQDIAPVANTNKLADDTKTIDDPNQALSLLRVTTKIQWKRLRNQYLLLQRKKYAEVKQLLNQNKTRNQKVSTLPLASVRPVTMKNKKFVSPTSTKRICTRNINFYGAMRDEQNTNTYECSIIDSNTEKVEDEQTSDKKAKTKDLQIEFKPGIIVKVNFDDASTDLTDFKAEMKQYSFVKYVDLKEGCTFAHVRVDESRSAPILIKHCAPKRCQILTGDCENEYWTKIAKDRQEKLTKRFQVKKTRSKRNLRKIIKNIAEVNVVKTLDNKTNVSHIRFED